MGQNKSQWPRDGWILIEAKYVGEGTGDNVHILPVTFTGEEGGKIKWEAKELRTIDGCSRTVSKGVNPLSGSVVYYDDENGRAKLISVQNDLHKKDLKACADCFGHLSADSVEEKPKTLADYLTFQ